MARSIRGWKTNRLLAVALLVFSTFVPLLQVNKAVAYGQLTSRAIKMSDSTPSATDVIYSVSFTGSGSVGGMVIEFCQNTPIIQDSCTAPTTFNLNKATLALANQTGLGANSFAIDGTNTTDNKLVLTRTAGSVTTVSFDLGTGSSDGITNPSQLGSFYARMVTYTTGTGAQNYLSTSIGAEPPVIDAGGIALSTAAQITVTAKVQERLTFCVYSDNLDAEYANNDCTSKQGTGVLLGDTNGVLDPTGPYVNKKARYSVTTNASGDVAIRMKGVTLTSGSNTITAIGGTEAASNPGVAEQFGLCTYEVAGSGLTPDAGYNGAAGAPAAECSGTTDTSGTGSPGGDNSALFALDTNNTTGTTSPYGDDIASKEAGDFSTGVLVFIGNITNTTEAGIYTTVLTFIATGTY